MSDEEKRQLAEYLRPFMPSKLLSGYGKRDQRITWAERYWSDPVAWAKDNIRWPEGQWLTSYQEDILSRIPERKRVSVRGAHGLGKTALSSIAVLWFITTREAMETDWKVPTTAGGERQLKRFFWPEIHKWARRLRFEKMYRDPYSTKTELMTLSCRLNYGVSFAASCDQPQLIEGAHADQLLYVFDEAKSIPSSVFDAAEGAFSGAGDEGREAYGLAISTPGPPEGRFWQIQTKRKGFEDWDVRPVTIEEIVEAKRVTWEWVEQRKQQWGEDSPIFRNRVLGEFSDDRAEGVIPTHWIELAMNRGDRED